MIQIYGERNSCNNYLVKLIEHNIGVNVVKSHQFPEYVGSKEHIILVKNPYAWLLSLHKKPHGSHNFRSKYVNLTFSNFLRARWGSYDNSVIRYDDIMKHYINFLKIYSNALLIHSEDLQENPEQVINTIATTFKIKQRQFKNIEKEVNSGGNLVDQFKKLDYYKNQEWKKELRKEDIRFINSIVSDEVFDYFSYKKL